MVRGIVFKGKKEFTAEYYATEIKNRSYKARDDNGYYIGYGNDLNYSIVGDRIFRLESGLFLVQGRQCAVVLGTSEEMIIPLQSTSVKCYIIAKINTNVISGDNISITYRIGSETAFPTLTTQDTYNISEGVGAVYELPLYSFTMKDKITNVVRLIKPIRNAQVQIDDISEGPSDYLVEEGLYIKKENNDYKLYKNNKEGLQELPINASTVNGSRVIKDITKRALQDGSQELNIVYTDNAGKILTLPKDNEALTSNDIDEIID